VKITGPTIKKFFSPEESRRIQIGLNKLARPEILKEAIVQYDTKNLSLV